MKAERYGSIVVIDPAVNRPEVECYNHLATLSQFVLHYHLPALVGMNSLIGPSYEDQIQGIIVLGSAASVYDDKLWQREFHTWLMQMMGRGIPTLGFCYGHQLIAHLFGGKVDYIHSSRKKETGFRKIEIKDDVLVAGKTLAGLVPVTHCEHVTKKPDQMRVIARSELFEFEGLRHEVLPVWSFQAHLEAVTDFYLRYNIGMPEDPADQHFCYDVIKQFFSYCAERSL